MPKDREAEIAADLEQQIGEYALLTNKIDALEDMRKQRKARILALMNETGMSRFAGNLGEASFTVRRSFTVHDPERLATLMTPVQLAALVKVTADVYDALSTETALDEAVTVGRSESLSVSRSKTKIAKDYRKKHIEESKRNAEENIQSIRESFRESKSNSKRA